MMNTIVHTIIAFCQQRQLDFELLDYDKATEITEKIATIFSIDLSIKYPWENLLASKNFFYDEDIGIWKKKMDEFLLEFDRFVYLAITDDEFYPWPIIKFCSRDIVSILESQHHFEFFIFDGSMNRILFDTHDNQLILCSMN